MKKINRLIVLLIAFVFLFSNCEKDDINIHSSTDNSSLKLSILEKNEINFNIKLKEKLEEIQSKQNEFQLKSQNSDLNFLIEIDNVRYIEKGDYHSYTFPILRKDKNNKKIKNLLIEVNKKGGYDALIISYDFTEKELENFTEEDLKSMKVSYEKIDFDFSELIVKCSPTCIEYYKLEMIDEGDKGELVGADNVQSPTYGWVLHRECTSCSGGGGIPDVSDPTTDPFDDGSNDHPGGVDDTYTSPTSPNESGYSVLEAYYSYNGMYLNSSQENWIINHQEQALLILNEILVNNSTLPGIGLALEMIDTLMDNTNTLTLEELIIAFEYEQDYRNRMSSSELAIFNSISRTKQLGYLFNGQKAIWKAEELFPNSLYNGPGDAFRHAYFNGLNVILLGVTLAESLATAHEDKPAPLGYTNYFKEKQMDLFNNEDRRNKKDWIYEG